MSDIKRFDEWNSVKKVLDNKKFKQNLKIKGIYWVSIGQNVGSEVFGKNKFFTRPVLVINHFYNGLFVGVPLTSQTKRRGKMYYHFIDSKDKLQVALLGQIRVFDVKRVTKQIISEIDDENFAKN